MKRIKQPRLFCNSGLSSCYIKADQTPSRFSLSTGRDPGQEDLMWWMIYLLFEEFSCKIYNPFHFSQTVLGVAKEVTEMEGILNK